MWSTMVFQQFTMIPLSLSLRKFASQAGLHQTVVADDGKMLDTFFQQGVRP